MLSVSQGMRRESKTFYEVVNIQAACVWVKKKKSSGEDFLRHTGQTADWWNFLIKEPKWCSSSLPSPVCPSNTKNAHKHTHSWVTLHRKTDISKCHSFGLQN